MAAAAATAEQAGTGQMLRDTLPVVMEGLGKMEVSAHPQRPSPRSVVFLEMSWLGNPRRPLGHRCHVTPPSGNGGDGGDGGAAGSGAPVVVDVPADDTDLLMLINDVNVAAGTQARGGDGGNGGSGGRGGIG